jgi:hypothetical protein
MQSAPQHADLVRSPFPSLDHPSQLFTGCLAIMPSVAFAFGSTLISSSGITSVRNPSMVVATDITMTYALPPSAHQPSIAFLGRVMLRALTVLHAGSQSCTRPRSPRSTLTSFSSMPAIAVWLSPSSTMLMPQPCFGSPCAFTFLVVSEHPLVGRRSLYRFVPVYC